MRPVALALSAFIIAACATPHGSSANRAATKAAASREMATAQTPADEGRCVRLPAASPQGLGDAEFLLVNPGDRFLGGQQLTTPRLGHDDHPDWTLQARSRVDLGQSTLEVWNVEAPGSGAGLVFVANRGDASHVVSTYAHVAGGNAGQVAIVGSWTHPSCSFATVLIEQTTEMRSFYATPGDEDSLVEGGTESAWIALGVAVDRAWIASDLLWTPPQLIVRDGWPELHTKDDGRLVTLKLGRDTLGFEPSLEK